PVARNHTVVLGQHLCDLVGPVLELPIGPQVPIGSVNSRLVRSKCFYPAVDQLVSSVENFWVLDIGDRKFEGWPQLFWGKIVSGKCIDMSRRFQLHKSSFYPCMVR